MDPQTGETVQMPDPDSVDQSDDSVLGDAPVNENLENVEPQMLRKIRQTPILLNKNEKHLIKWRKPYNEVFFCIAGLFIEKRS